jgi:serine phosphatase RsbU (regulator of sigma subunit)
MNAAAVTGWSPHDTITLPPAADSPRSARRFVLDILHGQLDEDTLDSALLLVTELVTNVVVHAGTAATVHVLPYDNGVTIGVRDRHPLRIGAAWRRAALPTDPDAEAADPLADSSASAGLGWLREDGRGLALVDALSTAWGTEHSGGGKTVWFRLGSGDPGTWGPAQQPPRPLPAAWPGVPPVNSATAEPTAAATTDRLAGSAATPASRSPAPRRPPRIVARDTARALSAEGEVAELLAQLVDALPVTGGIVRRPAPEGIGVDIVAALGSTGADQEALAFRLDPTQAGLGELLLWPDRRSGRGTVDRRAGRRTPAGGLESEADLERVLLASRWMALALGGGDMRRAEERRIGMLSFIAEASDLLAGSLDLTHSLALLARLPVPRLARWCAVYLRHENDSPALYAVGHADETESGTLWRAAADPDGELMAAVTAASGDQVRSVTALGGPALVVVLRARRRVLGVLALGRPAGEPFAADEADLLADLARRAAFAVDNARLYGRQVEVANALQAGLRPPELPVIPGIELGSAYGAARSAGLDVGGDFYDLVPGPAGWTIAIGDVCGKGAEAATVTGVARAVLRLLTGQGADLGQILAELNRALRDTAASYPSGQVRFCTLAAATFAPATAASGAGSEPRGTTSEIPGTAADVAARLRLHLAGHPQPVVLHADGHASFAGLPGTLLGVLADDEVSFPGVDIALHPGEALVLYTDGVVEARRDRELLGERRLLAAVSGCAGLSAQGTANRVLAAAERFAGGNLRDDVAILVARALPRAQGDAG